VATLEAARIANIDIIKLVSGKAQMNSVLQYLLFLQNQPQQQYNIYSEMNHQCGKLIKMGSMLQYFCVNRLK
jgi:hypothetical protein